MTAAGISVLVPTFGRTRVLAEVIESFLRQDYNDVAEMIVLNDHPEQRLELDAFSRPGRSVVVVNAPRFSDLGTKRNQLVSMAAYSWCWMWDDDDIYLPDALARMRYLRETRAGGFRCARESHCWQMQAAGSPRNRVELDAMGPVTAIAPGLELVVRDSGPMWAMAMEVAALVAVGGFEPHDRRQDIDLCHRLVQRQWVPGETNTPGRPSCIHRLAGTPYAHAIDFTGWKGPQDNAASQAFHAAATSALMDLGEEPRGTIAITPRWALDYVALANAAWAVVPGRTMPRIGEPPTWRRP